MYESKNRIKLDFGGIYHELEELSDLLREDGINSYNSPVTTIQKKMENTLQNLKEKVITCAVEDVLTDLMQENSLNSRNRSNTDKKIFNKNMIQAGVKSDITLQEAVRLIEHVEETAALMGIPVVVAVYNHSAHPVAVHCMEYSYIASYDVAIHKAYTCAALKMSTVALKALSQPGGELYGIQHTNEGKIVIFGGGEPLIYGGKLIGAIGVSGGSEEQDTKLAEIGRNKLLEVMTW